jgi:hypothetical protein
MNVMVEWTSLARANAPRVVRESEPASWFVCTDASKWGWGYVALNRATGAFRTYGQQWTTEQLSKIFSRNNIYKIKKSVYSEPLAVYYSLCHLLNSNEPMQLKFAEEITKRIKICVATDNSSTAFTMKKGFATRSFDINHQIQNLKHSFPDSHFDIDFSFIPGWMNPADDDSRGRRNYNKNAKLGQTIETFKRQWDAEDFTKDSTGRPLCAAI